MDTFSKSYVNIFKDKMRGKIVHSPLLNFPKLQKNPVKAMRLKLCHFHQNYPKTFMESFQFQDNLIKVILNINHDPLQEILGFYQGLDYSNLYLEMSHNSML